MSSSRDVTDRTSGQKSDPLHMTIGGDKVSMFINTYPHTSLRKIKVTICNYQADVRYGDLYDERYLWSYVTPNVLFETRCH